MAITSVQLQYTNFYYDYKLPLHCNKQTHVWRVCILWLMYVLCSR